MYEDRADFFVRIARFERTIGEKHETLAFLSPAQTVAARIPRRRLRFGAQLVAVGVALGVADLLGDGGIE
jgi:hypothetical protein